MSATEFKERLRGDLKAAMQNRATGEAKLIRTLIAALDNAEAVPVEGMHDHSRSSAMDAPMGEVARLELNAATIDTLLMAEIDARLAAAADYAKFGREDEAARLTGEAGYMRRYLAR